MYQITQAFAVPVVVAHYENCGGLNADLRALFLEMEAEGDKFRNPDPLVDRNEQLFESNFSLFDWQRPPIQKLKDFCWSNLYRAIGELNGYDVNFLRRLHIQTEAWFHITKRGGYFGPHNHPLHSWSGVYCVCQEGDDPASDSGKLSFLNPFMTTNMFLDHAISKLQPPYNSSHLKVRLQPGQLVLFPSWLLHEVTYFDGDGLRITVAFNARFRLEGVAPPKYPMP